MIKKPLNRFALPGPAGLFGAIRKHDIHTGLDLHCINGSNVYAMESGHVCSSGPFTGTAVSMSWWNDTDYLVIKGKKTCVLYGEITINPNLGFYVDAGQLIGQVKTVLKKNKGLPMTMLHLEHYRNWPGKWAEWELNNPKPQHLIDPINIVAQSLLDDFCFKPTTFSIPSGDWFTISEKGTVFNLKSSFFDPVYHQILIGDKVLIDECLYSVVGVQSPPGLSLFLRK